MSLKIKITVPFLILIFFLILCKPIVAQSSFNWGLTSEVSKYTSVVVDTIGNIYVLGSFGGTIDADPGPGVTSLTYSGLFLGDRDLILQKFDSLGNFIWAKHWYLGLLTVSGNSFYHITANDSALFIQTMYSGTRDFDPNAGTSFLTSAGLEDIAIFSLDFDGNFNWVKTFASTSNMSSGTIVAKDNYLYLTGGVFNFTVDFDPGPGVSNLTASLVGNYLVKLTYAGDFVWARNFNVNFNSSSYPTVNIDNEGGLVYIFHHQNPIDADPGAGSNILPGLGIWDTHIIKLDASGIFEWAIEFDSLGFATLSAEFDYNNNVYIFGRFRGTQDFDPGPATEIITAPTSYYVPFLLKLDKDGNFQWVKTFEGLTYYGILKFNPVDTNLFLTGIIESDSTADLDPGPAVVSVTAPNSNRLWVIIELDTNGNYILSKSADCGSAFFEKMLITDNNDKILVGTANNIDANPDASDSLIGTGAVIIKLNQLIPDPVPLPVLLDDFQAECKGNQIKVSWSTAAEINNDYFILNKSNEQNDLKKFKIKGNGNSSNKTDYQIMIDNDYSPSYYQLSQIDLDGIKTDLGKKFLNCSNTNAVIKLIPNPNNGEFLSLSFPRNKYNKIQLYNSLGTLINNQNIRKDQSEIHFKFDKRLAPGQYVARIINQYSSISKKFIVN
jgi:hypothetical protein